MRFCCTFGWLAVTNPHAVPPASPPYLPTPTQDKESWELSDSEKIEHAKAKKEKGNVLYKQGKYLRAAAKYNKVGVGVGVGFRVHSKLLRRARNAARDCLICFGLHHTHVKLIQLQSLQCSALLCLLRAHSKCRSMRGFNYRMFGSHQRVR